MKLLAGRSTFRAGVWLAFATALAIMLLPAAAAAQPQPSAQEARVNLLPQGEPDSLDPDRSSFAFASEGAIVRQVFEPLLRLDEQLTPQPAAAESYDVSADGRVVAFHLRPDGRWSDGQPVTAAQFAYAWQRLLSPSSTSEYGAFFVAAGIASVRAVDDLTFELQLKGPFGAIPALASLWVSGPLRPDIVDADPDGWADKPSTFIGNGPFMIGEWVHQDHLTLIPNPSYSAHGMWPKPTLTRVTVSMDTSGESDLAAFLKGQRDWVQVPDAHVNQVLNDPLLAKEAREYNELTSFWVQLNNSRAPLSDVNLRRALAKGLDRTALVRDTASGLGAPSTSIIPRGMPGFQEDLGRDLAFDAQAGRTSVAQLALDPAQPLTLSYPTTAGYHRRAEYLQAQWLQNLGLEIQLVTLDPAAYQQAIANKNYDMAFGGWSADYPDPQDWFATLFSCNGSFNQSNYCNSLFDQIVARADTTSTQADRLQQYSQAQSVLMQDVPVVPLFARGRLALSQPWVQTIDGGKLPVAAQDEYPGSFFLDKVRILPH